MDFIILTEDQFSNYESRVLLLNQLEELLKVALERHYTDAAHAIGLLYEEISDVEDDSLIH